jgi:hypothetical protein
MLDEMSQLGTQHHAGIRAAKPWLETLTATTEQHAHVARRIHYLRPNFQSLFLRMSDSLGRPEIVSRIKLGIKSVFRFLDQRVLVWKLIVYLKAP